MMDDKFKYPFTSSLVLDHQYLSKEYKDDDLIKELSDMIAQQAIKVPSPSYNKNILEELDDWCTATTSNAPQALPYPPSPHASVGREQAQIKQLKADMEEVTKQNTKLKKALKTILQELNQ